MRLLLIADTHLPLRAKALPDQVWREVEARSKRLIGVYGNNDGADLRARLPEIARAELDGVRLAVIHETGGKLRPLNPGSPTDRRRQPFRAYQTAEIRDGELRDVALHELPLRR